MSSKIVFDKRGSFRINNPDKISFLYFPLVNQYGMKSCITPKMHGDNKIDVNHFGLIPVSVLDLEENKLSRNMFFNVNGNIYSITGNTPIQKLENDDVVGIYDFLSQKVKRTNKFFEIEVTSFVPEINANMELHKVSFKALDDLIVKPVIGFPLYGRSADNIRDHRHVTSLLNRIKITNNSLTLFPTLSFDERGHNINDFMYDVTINSALKIKNYWPILEEFIGEGNDFETPEVVKSDLNNSYKTGDVLTGYEMIAGFEYEKQILKPGEEISFVIGFTIDNKNNLERLREFVSTKNFDYLLNKTKTAWENEIDKLQFNFYKTDFSNYLRWVTIQPILRKIYGCSFLPFHDYGRGGRGWRDLWQDIIALELINAKDIKSLIVSNFGGVRIDGTNATIIGDRLGEFKADRNNIVRVWMDHAAWPTFSTNLYINRTGDIRVLLEEKEYFKDKFVYYTKIIDEDYIGETNKVLTSSGQVYYGSILEHLLIENLVAFYHVGKHGNILLCDADWNDGIDMANELGESVAFTGFYKSNFDVLARLTKKLNELGIKEIEILKELAVLIENSDYSIVTKKSVLNKYFSLVKSSVSGAKIKVSCDELTKKFIDISSSISDHINENELMKGEKYSFYNGYYDNKSERFENPIDKKMTLIGQVFNVMGGVASTEQIKKIIEASNDILFDENVKGYRLNSKLKEDLHNIGRFMGFGYGHKENGAVFEHMNVMYGNALYKRGFVKEGSVIIRGVYDYVNDIEKSKCLPGIPEYFDSKGRGVYPYLTGSAAWYLYTIAEEIFGVKGDFGDLIIEPKLLIDDFIDLKAEIKMIFNDQNINIQFENKDNLDYQEYMIKKVLINGKSVVINNSFLKIKKENIKEDLNIIVNLGAK